ncbi:hypothetical protein CWS02_03630 [Enterobacter sp. EA-1]|nr:hypothetical protein CWS02_03630 [Enterobacter sp. EA-1]
MVADRDKEENEKTKKKLAYVVLSIIFFLIIPEVVLRVVSTDDLGRLSDYTSLWGTLNPLLSLLISLGLASFILAFLTVFIVGKIFRALSRLGLNQRS